jgi:hypothetical protein
MVKDVVKDVVEDVVNVMVVNVFIIEGLPDSIVKCVGS